MVKFHFKLALSSLLTVTMISSSVILNCTSAYASELNKANLQSAIEKAQITINTTIPGNLGGQYPQSDYDFLNLSVRNAQKILTDNSTSQNVIDNTTSGLNVAVSDYLKKRIEAPWDKYNVPDVMPVKKREVRAAWLSTVVNIDWPSTSSWKITDKAQRIETQKKDLITEMDYLKSEGVNTVFFQVRPTSDAFYKSKLSPWSYWLTGKYDEDPGFDPLQFAIDEAHKRCMELHAWCNPYRVSMPASLYKDESGNKLTSLDQVKAMLLKDNNNIYAKHPEWVKVATNRLVLDPGIPEAQKYVEDCIMEIVNNYDIDGIHFDDYFYVGNNGGFDNGYSDIDTYNTYADKKAFPDIKDWRRNNTYTLIKEIHEKINASKPWVKFGISPAGVWRNKSDDPTGSDTRAGIPNYDSAYADTKKWVLEGIIDYICPQVYWSFGNKYAPYGIVASWWSDLLKNNPNVKTQLYIGMGLYWLNPDDEQTSDPYWNTLGVGDQEIARQLKFNAANPDIDGSALFTYNSFLAKYPNAQSAASMIKNNLWASKALVTSMSWKNVTKAAKPTVSSATYNKNGVTLNWTSNDENTRYFAVYRFNKDENVNINNPLKLIDKIYKSSNGKQSYTDPKGTEDSKYVITALNRVSDESNPSNIISTRSQIVVNSKISWNDAVTQAMSLFADGGGYYTGNKHPDGFTQNTWEGMDKAFQMGPNDSKPTIDVSEARPSFCSSATYMLLLKSLSIWDNGHNAISRNAWINLKPYTLSITDKSGNVIPSENDGYGCWGRANANGPGLGVLVNELGVGENYYIGNKTEYLSLNDYYTAWDQAKPGDFLKIFWNSGIGCDDNDPKGDEAGHMVLFLGREKHYDADGTRNDVIKYWSSNGSHTDINAGYGIQSCNISKIYRAVATRVTKPENFNKADSIDRFNVNQWLSSLNGKHHGTVEELKYNIGIKTNQTPSNGSNTNSNGGTTVNNNAGQNNTIAKAISSTESNKAKVLPKTGSFVDFYDMLALGCALLVSGVLLINKKSKKLMK